MRPVNLRGHQLAAIDRKRRHQSAIERPEKGKFRHWSPSYNHIEMVYSFEASSPLRRALRNRGWRKETHNVVEYTFHSKRD